jgi:23S rRNA pseudouridine2604 synthase
MTQQTGEDGIRLAKRVADAVGCSRADAERYIAGGWVSVDGVVAEDPAARVTAAQTVALLPGAVAEEPLPVTILLNKPAGLDIAGALALLSEQTLFAEGRQPRFLKRHLAKLTLATPLEQDAAGVVVFSQDWRVLRKLVEDGKRIEQEFVAEMDGHVDDEALARLQAAIGPVTPLKVSRQSEARLRFAGKNIRLGQLGALCAKVGLRVTGLRRLRVGRVALAGLPVGRWRYVPDTERF